LWNNELTPVVREVQRRGRAMIFDGWQLAVLRARRMWQNICRRSINGPWWRHGPVASEMRRRGGATIFDGWQLDVLWDRTARRYALNHVYCCCCSLFRSCSMEKQHA
jgi:hypothetical protein